nr:GH32 C-terminal domain-containing protein [Serratia fonticola]
MFFRIAYFLTKISQGTYMSYARTMKKKLPSGLVIAISAALLYGCDNSSSSHTPDDNTHVQSSYLEKYRPQLQYTAAKNWQNDPNGLVYYDGEYHLFYQYNPNGNGWGDMSWGHAVSTDLVHWEELPVALAVEKDADGKTTEMFFSGSAVVDIDNTSGLGQPGKPAMIAMYTSYYPSTVTLANGKTIEEGTQAQSIAYSLDKGRTWRLYANNPVLPLPPAGYEEQFREFRDPKMFWYEPEKKWVMVAVLATEHKAVLYSSKNLLEWQFMSEFGPANATAGVWECPDLFELPVDGDPANTKWVMIINLNPGGPVGGSGSQYFIGNFDGTTFEADNDNVFDNTPVQGTLVENFEGDYNSVAWTATGDLVDRYLSRGDNPGQSGVSLYQGEQLLNTFVDSDAATGTVTSPPFRITDNYINLMVGGGNHPHNPESTLNSELPVGDLLFAGADFEGEENVTYSQLGWTAEGDFINQPVATGTIRDQQPVSGFLGSHLVNSFFGQLINKEGGDSAVGTLTSPAFTIEKPYINFLIGGGNNPYGKSDATAVVLVINGEVVRSATGNNSENLNWANWDVAEYQGQQARIAIIDENTGGWGHILADHFIASDLPAKPISSETTVNLLVNDKIIYSETGSNSEALDWRSWNVASLKGENAQIQVIDNNTGGWGHILVDHILLSDHPKQTANWADFGSDFYAAVSWNGVPDGKRYWIGWLSNWDYAGSVPSSPWRGGQTLVRELKLQTVGEQIKLTQAPVESMTNLRGKPLYHLKEETVLETGDNLLADANVHGQVYEIEAQLKPENATEVGFKLRKGEQGEETLVGYDALAGEVYLDRTKSGESAFSSGFAARHSAPLPLSEDGTLKLRIIVDTSSVTVFSGKGDVVLTDLIFPDPSSTGIEVYSQGSSSTISAMTIWPLKSIWADK